MPSRPVSGSRDAVQLDVRRRSAEPVAEPLRPDPVQRGVGHHERAAVPRRGLLEGAEHADPLGLRDGRRRALPAGDPRGQPDVPAEQPPVLLRRVTEDGENFLVRVEGDVGHLERVPVPVRVLVAEETQERLEAPPGVHPAALQLRLLVVLDPGGQRQHGDVPRGAVQDRVGDRRRAVDALRVEREAVDHGVRQLHRADPGRVAGAGPAVDQHEVVERRHVVAQVVDQPAAVRPVPEAVPVEGADRLRVPAVLPARWHEVQVPALRKVPGEGGRVLLDPGHLTQLLRRGLRAQRGVGVLADQVQDALGAA
jgi:hypothetical protein